jgi:hypothetical protein
MGQIRNYTEQDNQLAMLHSIGLDAIPTGQDIGPHHIETRDVSRYIKDDVRVVEIGDPIDYVHSAWALNAAGYTILSGDGRSIRYTD